MKADHSAAPGFESQAQHLCFAIFNLNLNCNWKWTKRGRERPIFKK